MDDSSKNNKRIAKNTLFLYFRMILIVLVTLYTSRVVLRELGVVDYGIYNVVGGVVGLFAFLNNCMITSTQRFLTFEIGKGKNNRLKEVFAASFNIHVAIALLSFIIAETIGLWLVNEKLVFPEERKLAANCVYQFSIISFCINITKVPYNATIIAHEKMSAYAYISIIEVILNLIMAYCLVIVSYDKLIIYGACVLAIQIVIRGIYQLYCKRHYKECQVRFFWNKELYYEMTGFAGWNLFGSIAWMMRDQGINILLNIFFGPIVNASRSIATQVSNAMMNFVSNFQIALNPQITKDYAQKKLADMEILCHRGIRYSEIILFLLAFPICLNIKYILSIWLTEVPYYASSFIILIIIDGLIGSLFGIPLMTSISATGKIRNYQLLVNTIILGIVPISYIMLLLGANVFSVFYITIILSGLSGSIRFLFCRHLIGYSLKSMLKKVIIPLLGMAIISTPIPLLCKIYFFEKENFTNFFISSLIAILISIFSAWYIAIPRNERSSIRNKIKNRFRKDKS